MIISRSDLEARTLFFSNARARNTDVEATSNHPFPAQAAERARRADAAARDERLALEMALAEAQAALERLEEEKEDERLQRDLADDRAGKG